MKCVFSLIVFCCVVVAVRSDHHSSGVNCVHDCHVCETLAAPKLRALHHKCPGCECARQLVNATVPPCPAVLRDRFCLQGFEVDGRGCPTGRCRVTRMALYQVLLTLQKCKKTCPGGYQIEADGSLSCRCACPLDRIPSMYRHQFCSERCTRSASILFNKNSGCQECVCTEEIIDDCPPFQCQLYCPNGYEMDAAGCRTCRCLPDARCPPVPICENDCGAEGRARDPLSGCITSCECRRVPELPKSALCPPVGCNKNCGSHELVSMRHEGCVTGCSCRCVMPDHCPNTDQQGVCVERVRDQYGCPTCDCARRAKSSVRKSKVSLCPDSRFWSPEYPAAPASDLCPSSCPNSLRQYDGERNCERCECCSNLQQQCPDLQCKENRVDHWGCPMCACVEDSK